MLVCSIISLAARSCASHFSRLRQSSGVILKRLNGVLSRYDKEHPPPLLLHTEVFSVRDQLLRLVKRLEGGRPFDVLDDLRALSCRAEAVAAFLAVLEMAKLSLIRLHQTDAGAILLYRTATELDAATIEGLQ